jgi:hypothetical protein
VGSPGSTGFTPCPAGTWSRAGAAACTPVTELINQAIDAYVGAGSGLAKALRDKAAAITSAPNARAKASALRDFIDLVNAKRSKPLTDAQADDLIALAMRL